MSRVPLCLAFLSAAMPAAVGQDNPFEREKLQKDKKTALLRFYDSNRFEHVYTYGVKEPAAWRKDPDKTEETVIGYASTVELPGTKRFHREVRPDGQHYFFLYRRPFMKAAAPEPFVLYVWTDPAPGRIPVHACVTPDGLDLFADPDPAKVRERVRLYPADTGKRHVISGMFYLLADGPNGKAGTQVADGEKAAPPPKTAYLNMGTLRDGAKEGAFGSDGEVFPIYVFEVLDDKSFVGRVRYSAAFDQYVVVETDTNGLVDEALYDKDGKVFAVKGTRKVGSRTMYVVSPK